VVARESRFDGQEPELIAHRSVEIQPGGTAYAFVIGTDAAPYVVKSTKLDDDRLEIPIRTATATRSADTQSDYANVGPFDPRPNS